VPALDRDALQRDVTRLAEGDRSAFDAVFAALWPLLSAYTSRHLPAPDAEDAAQSALVKLFSRASEFDASRDAVAWALGIATHEVLTLRKRRQRRREGPLPETSAATSADQSPSPPDTLIAAERAELVDRAMRSLAPGDAATLEALLAGRRPEGVEPATFRKRVQRVVERLRTMVKQRHDLA
jgi:RNA polymerase sigma-70 factor (ECF subfamily)